MANVLASYIGVTHVTNLWEMKMECGIDMKCKDCGECCKWVIFPGRKPSDPDQLLLFEWRGCEFIKMDYGEFIAFPCKCKWYDEKEKCTIYKDRPEYCREYTKGCEACLIVRRLRK
jgi:Fe-S-cluster containining protein